MPAEAVNLEEGETGRDLQAHQKVTELHSEQSGVGWLLPPFFISLGRLLQNPNLLSIKEFSSSLQLKVTQGQALHIFSGAHTLQS